MSKVFAFRLSSYLSLCFLVGILSSCTRERIGVSNEYISLKSLASYHVNTPDPRQICPPTGQRLNIYWNLKKELHCYNEMHLEFIIRYRSHEEESITIPIKQPVGSYLYYILNERYGCTGGVLAYKLELWADGEMIDEWTHLLWTEWIQLNSDQTDSKEKSDQTEVKEKKEDEASTI